LRREVSGVRLMMRRAWLVGFGLILGTALAGCNAGMETQEARLSAATPPPPATTLAALPAGASCSEKITHYRSVLEADHATGNVDPPVYAEITREISAAASACAAGRNGEALNLIRASEGRHGYHV